MCDFVGLQARRAGAADPPAATASSTTCTLQCAMNAADPGSPATACCTLIWRQHWFKHLLRSVLQATSSVSADHVMQTQVRYCSLLVISCRWFKKVGETYPGTCSKLELTPLLHPKPCQHKLVFTEIAHCLSEHSANTPSFALQTACSSNALQNSNSAPGHCRRR